MYKIIIDWKYTKIALGREAQTCNPGWHFRDLEFRV